MKAILIARVSTEEQRGAGNSLPAPQGARLERYCHNKGFEIVEVYSFDESAYTDDRSEFDRIIDLILNQTEKVVVCCDKADRLHKPFNSILKLGDRQLYFSFAEHVNEEQP